MAALHSVWPPVSAKRNNEQARVLKPHPERIKGFELVVMVSFFKGSSRIRLSSPRKV